MALRFSRLARPATIVWVLPLLVCLATSLTAEQVPLTAEEMFQTNALRFEDTDRVLANHVPAIREVVESTLRRVIQVLPLTAVTITVIPDPKRTIPGYGIGGYTPNANTVSIYLDPTFPEFAQVLSDRLPRTLAHEFHHCLRWRGPGYGRTLFEALITEGLADHFTLELLNGVPSPWSDAFPRDDTAKYLDLALAELDTKDYNHARWFFRGDHILPRWTGYTVGFRLVEAYKAHHPGATATTLVHTPARVFRPH